MTAKEARTITEMSKILDPLLPVLADINSEAHKGKDNLSYWCTNEELCILTAFGYKIDYSEQKQENKELITISW